MYIEELADKIARDIIDGLKVAPKPLLGMEIVSQTDRAIERYRREVIEACKTKADIGKLQDEIHTLFVELLEDIDLKPPLN